MMHWKHLALGLWLVVHISKIFVPLLPLPMAPLQPYESPRGCLVCSHLSDTELESFVKLMVDLSLWNKN